MLCVNNLPIIITAVNVCSLTCQRPDLEPANSSFSFGLSLETTRLLTVKHIWTRGSTTYFLIPYWLVSLF